MRDLEAGAASLTFPSRPGSHALAFPVSVEVAEHPGAGARAPRGRAYVHVEVSYPGAALGGSHEFVLDEDDARRFCATIFARLNRAKERT